MIRIVGPVLKHDGYGEMARQLCLGLIESGHDVTITSVLFGGGPDLKNLKAEYEVLKNYIDKPGVVSHVIQCLTPDNFPHFMSSAVNIAYCMWECSKLPAHWTGLLNNMDGVWVPSTFCKKVFVDSGVTKPVHIVPLVTDTAKFDNIGKNENLLEMLEGRLAFYSIFEWSERKNPEALLNAYYSTFGADDNVMLVVKSYVSGDEEENKKKIYEMAYGFRNRIIRHGKDYPKIVCISEFLTTEQILQIHKTCDVYLGPVRGEGWSIPMFDAALAGNHIIATNYSSHTDFLDTYNTHKFQVYDLCSYQLEPVHSMHSLYTPDQRWASVNVHFFGLYMKQAYEKWKQTGEVPSKHHASRYSTYLREAYDRKKVAERLKELL